MEPAFIYFDDLTFNDKKFTLKFSQEKETKNFFLKKKKDSFITSFTYFVKLDITKHKNYKIIPELSEICRNSSLSSISAGFNLDKVTFITDKTGLFNKQWEKYIN